MIIDCHTHVWEAEHLSDDFIGDQSGTIGPAAMDYSLVVNLDAHYAALKDVDKAVVLGFRSKHLKMGVPNEYVAQYVARDPHKLIGFCSVDPNEPKPVAELTRCVKELGLKGLKISPVYQAFHPWDEHVQPLLKTAQDLGITTLWHMGTTVSRIAPLDGANPILLDRIAIQYPDLRMILAHFGHPWQAESISLMRKHPHVYADMSSMYARPWQFYQTLLLASEYGVLDKVVFGSDYPFFTPDATIGALRNVNAIPQRAGLPEIPTDAIEKILGENGARALAL